MIYELGDQKCHKHCDFDRGKSKHMCHRKHGGHYYRPKRTKRLGRRNSTLLLYYLASLVLGTCLISFPPIYLHLYDFLFKHIFKDISSYIDTIIFSFLFEIDSIIELYLKYIVFFSISRFLNFLIHR